MTICCRKCGRECEESDFVNESNDCYKCIYKEKVKNSILDKKTKVCRICNEKCGKNRSVYCSDECAKTGEREQKAQHWTMTMNKNLNRYQFLAYRRRFRIKP
jgi:hypothetical protein